MCLHKKIIGCVIVLVVLIAGEFWPAHTVSSQEDQRPILSIAWKPDGTEFATGHPGGKVTIWDAATRQPRLTFDVAPDYPGALAVSSLAWSPDGSTLAAAASLGGGSVRLLDPTTGALLATFKAETLSTAVAWSPDGSLLAGGASRGLGFISEGWVRIWDVATGQVVAEILNGGGDTSNVSDLSWSADGSRLACASINWAVIWDTATWETVFTLEHPATRLDHLGLEATNSVSAVAWSPQGSRLATGDADTIRIWDGFSGELLATFDNAGHPLSLTWSPSGTQLASATLDVQIWDVATGQLVEEFPGLAGVVAWSPDGTQIVYNDGSTLGIVIPPTPAPTSTPTPHR